MLTMTKQELYQAKLRFSQQRCMAGKRGIEWKLTFDEWINWWMATGVYHLRGRGKGKYVMARYSDQGAYELGNIEAKLHGVNIREAHLGNTYNNGRKHSVETKLAVSKRISGAGNPSARKVKIHGQTYDCIKDAAKAIGIGYSLCKKRLRNNIQGYEYL